MSTHEEPRTLWRRITGPDEEELERLWSEARARHEPLEIRYSPTYWGPVLVLALAFLSLFVPPIEDDLELLVPGLLLTTPFLWLSGRRLLTRKPAVSFDESGVNVPKRALLVPWDRLSSVTEVSPAPGFGHVVLVVRRAWARDNLGHLLRMRLVGRLLLRNDVRLGLPAGLTVRPDALHGWLTGLVIERSEPRVEDATHLLVKFTDNSMIADPDCDSLLNLVGMLGDGELDSMRVAHIGLDPTGESSLVVERVARGAIGMREENPAGASETTVEKDPDVAGDMVLAWVKAVDAEVRQRSG